MKCVERLNSVYNYNTKYSSGQNEIQFLPLPLGRRIAAFLKTVACVNGHEKYWRVGGEGNAVL